MKRLIATIFVAVLLSACAVTGGTFGNSPESQIVTGANALTATATVATALLKNNRINVVQARSYQAVLVSASGHLDTANATLVACRKKTSSTPKTSPDPCAAGIEADIRLAVSIANEVSTTLKGK